MELRQPVVVSDFDMIEPVACRRSSLISKRTYSLSHFFVLSDDCSTFRSGDLLVGIEAKDPRSAKGAHFLALPFRSDRSEEHTSELQSPYVISYAVFLLNDPAPTEIYTLPLHDPLPICDLLVGIEAKDPRSAKGAPFLALPFRSD